MFFCGTLSEMTETRSYQPDKVLSKTRVIVKNVTVFTEDRWHSSAVGCDTSIFKYFYRL